MNVNVKVSASSITLIHNMHEYEQCEREPLKDNIEYFWSSIDIMDREHTQTNILSHATQQHTTLTHPTLAISMNPKFVFQKPFLRLMKLFKKIWKKK